MATQSNTRNPKVSGGVDRTFESIDVRHPHYPVGLYLFARERFYNLVRHNATDVQIKFQEKDDGNFLVKMRDNGDGAADENRLLEPAEEGGMSSSKYGFGERIVRLKMGSRYSPSLYAWKKAGELFYHVLDQTATGYRLITTSIDMKDAIWEKKEDHGFYSEIDFIPDRLEGRTKQDIIPIVRSVLCMSLTPEVLATLHVHIEIRDARGDILREIVNPGKLTKTGKLRKTREPRIVGIADSIDGEWKSLVSILLENALDGNILEKTGTLSSGAKINVKYLRLTPSSQKYYEGVKEYTDTKACAALVIMNGFVMPIPLPEALGKAVHPASQNGRFAIVTITPVDPLVDNVRDLSPLDLERIRQLSMPTPASSKVTFLASCPVYQDMLAFIRAGREGSKWDAFVKKGATSESDSDSQEEPTGDVGIAHTPPPAGAPGNVLPVMTDHAIIRRKAENLLEKAYALLTRLPGADEPGDDVELICAAIESFVA